MNYYLQREAIEEKKEMNKLSKEGSLEGRKGKPKEKIQGNKERERKIGHKERGLKGGRG